MTPEQADILELLARVERLEREAAVHDAAMLRAQEQMRLMTELCEQVVRNQGMLRLRAA